MEKKSSRKSEEHKALITELREGLGLAEQLRSNLYFSTSHLSYQNLLTSLLSSFDKAIHLLNTTPSSAYRPFFRHGSLNNEETHPPYALDTRQLNFSKKRKVAPRWTEYVRIYSKNCETPVGDGFSWRKYGQKDILGTTFPRGYYRCSHRHMKGCMATKQVQRSDKDPSVIEITYRGKHTCVPSSTFAGAPPSMEPVTAKIGAVKKFATSFCQSNSDRKKQFYNEELEKVPELLPRFSFLSSEEEGENDYGFASWLRHVQGEQDPISSAPPSGTNSPIWYMEDVPPMDLDTSFSFDVVDLFT